MRRTGVAEEPFKIRQHVTDQSASARVLARRGLGKKGEKIARLLDGFGPVGCRLLDEHLLKRVLAGLEGGLIGLNAEAQPTQLGRLLGRHAAVLVEIDRSIGHGTCSAVCLSNPTGPKPGVALGHQAVQVEKRLSEAQTSTSAEACSRGTPQRSSTLAIRSRLVRTPLRSACVKRSHVACAVFLCPSPSRMAS